MTNEQDLIGCILNAGRCIERMLDKHARLAGLRGSQARVLCFLSIVTPKRNVFQKDIEAAFEIRASSATGILQSLERQGLIRRDSASLDGRLKKIVLTDKAKDMQTRSIEFHRSILKKLQGELDDEELARFMTTCNEIAVRAQSDADAAQEGRGEVRSMA